MSEKCPLCGDSGTLMSVKVKVDGRVFCEDCGERRHLVAALVDKLAQKDRELEQSRQSEAQALAKLADLAHAARHVKLKAIGVTTADTKYRLEQKEDLLCEAITHLDTILADAPKVLAVVDDALNGYGELHLSKDFASIAIPPSCPVRVIVLRRDEGGK